VLHQDVDEGEVPHQESLLEVLVDEPLARLATVVDALGDTKAIEAVRPVERQDPAPSFHFLSKPLGLRLPAKLKDSNLFSVFFSLAAVKPWLLRQVRGITSPGKTVNCQPQVPPHTMPTSHQFPPWEYPHSRTMSPRLMAHMLEWPPVAHK
jgi:hypothetical protein